MESESKSSNSEKKLIALDNNAFASAVGLFKKVQALAKQNKIDFEQAFEIFDIDEHYKKSSEESKLRVKILYAYMKWSLKKKIRFVITPTVSNEIFQVRTYQKGPARQFYYKFCVKLGRLKKEFRPLSDSLVQALMSPHRFRDPNEGFCYTDERIPIEGNFNSNHDHDARIYAEAIILGADLLSFDNDFANRDIIRQTTKHFEQEHTDLEGISQHKIILPNLKRKQNNFGDSGR